MRESRVVLENVEAFYHVSNEIRNDFKELSTDEQKYLERFIFEASECCKVEIIAYTVYPLGYDMLIRIPKPERVKDIELEAVLKKHFSEQIWDNYINLKKSKNKERLKEFRNRHKARFYNLQDFMRLFSQRFSRFYNENHNRSGQVWRQRFRSFPVADDGDVLRDVIGYVHVRPLSREKSSKDPVSYSFSSWSRVVSGDPSLRKIYNNIIGEKDWRRSKKKFLSSMEMMQGRLVRPYYGEINKKLVEKYRKKNRMTGDMVAERKKHWKSMYNKLKRYGEKTGSYVLPSKSEKFKDLNRWVKLQRSYYKKDKISEEHKALLEKINFPFEKESVVEDKSEKNRKISAIWLKKYEILKKYKEKHGAIKPPYNDNEVYAFVNYQRSMKKKNKLTVDQVTMLDELNFPWKASRKKK